MTTVPYMEAGMIPPHWSDLVHSSSELVSKHALNLAQSWLGSTCQYNTDLQFTDKSVVDSFAIVTDHHTSSITKTTHLDQAPKTLPIRNSHLRQRCCHKLKWQFPREVP
jgi:hypothetical protein